MKLRLSFWMTTSVLLSSALTAPTWAQKAPPVYPNEGKIVGIGVNSVTSTRTYRVLTETKSYELDCGKHAFLSRTPPECGGLKKLQIGDVLHFRSEKDKVFIPVEPMVDPSGEQKLRVLKEELRPAPKADAKPADTK